LKEIQQELITKVYQPLPNRNKEIPKGKDKMRMLGIPAIRDRVVQGALKLIVEPIFESDFQEGSYGYRPKHTPHQALERVAEAVVKQKTKAIDLDLRAYFDTVRHDILLQKVAERVNDKDIMRLLKMILRAGGKRGVPQGGVVSPLLANLYLNDVDKMLEKAKEATRNGKYTYIEYARFADDVVVLIDGYRKWNWLARAVYRRLMEELAKLGVSVNEEKTKVVDLTKGESFKFLGFDIRRTKTLQGKWGVLRTPTMKARTSLLRNLKEIFRRYRSQPVGQLIKKINPVLRGWVNYFRIGNASRCFGYLEDWVQKKVRRHLMKARKLKGFGWNRWSREWLYQKLGLYNDYTVKYNLT
jgi:RNA-directed DNA polymerase